MINSSKKWIAAGLAVAVFTGAIAVAQIAPHKRRYGSNDDWYRDIAPRAISFPVDWRQYFPLEAGEFKMLHIPDQITFNNQTVEIVQEHEKSRYDVGKELFLEAIDAADLTTSLYRLHLHAVDLILDEEYERDGTAVRMTGYSIDLESLGNGKLLPKITLYTAGQTPRATGD